MDSVQTHGVAEGDFENHPEKFIICLAPHTSNWDFLLGQLYSRAEGMKINFLMKKEWFFWPLGPIFRSMGGIPVFRQKKMSMTDAMADTAKSVSQFKLCITPRAPAAALTSGKRFLLHRTQGRHTYFIIWGGL